MRGFSEVEEIEKDSASDKDFNGRGDRDAE